MGPAARGRRVVVARDESGDGGGELLGEGGALGRRGEADLLTATGEVDSEVLDWLQWAYDQSS
jgi:hypothetical protein